MKSVKTIGEQSPFPWRYTTAPGGQVVVIDSRGNQVPMFDMLELIVVVTTTLARTESASTTEQKT